MKQEAEPIYPDAGRMIEGPEAFERFENTMRGILSVPHSVIQDRVEAHRKEAARNPNRPGPKPKRRRRAKH